MPGRVERSGHRIKGDPRDMADGAAWEFLFVAIDDHAGVGLRERYGDERRDPAVHVQSALREWRVSQQSTLIL